MRIALLSVVLVVMGCSSASMPMADSGGAMDDAGPRLAGCPAECVIPDGAECTEWSAVECVATAIVDCAGCRPACRDEAGLLSSAVEPSCQIVDLVRVIGCRESTDGGAESVRASCAR